MKVDTSLICLLFCLSLAVLMNGCMTLNVRESVLRYQDYTTEFSQYNPRSFCTWDGVYSGIVEEDGSEWREYLFPGLLDGQDRVLRILVPVNIGQGIETRPDLSDQPEWNGPFVRILETSKQKETPTATQIVFMPYGAYSVDEMIREFNYNFPTLDINKYGSHLIIIADIHSGKDGIYFRNGNPSGELSQWIALPTQREVLWKKRNQAGFWLRKASYMLSVPIDLVTSPIQFIYFIWLIGQC